MVGVGVRMMPGKGVPVESAAGRVRVASRVRAGGMGAWLGGTAVGTVEQADKPVKQTTKTHLKKNCLFITKKLYQSALALHFSMC